MAQLCLLLFHSFKSLFRFDNYSYNKTTSYYLSLSYHFSPSSSLFFIADKVSFNHSIILFVLFNDLGHFWGEFQPFYVYYFHNLLIWLYVWPVKGERRKLSPILEIDLFSILICWWISDCKWYRLNKLLSNDKIAIKPKECERAAKKIVYIIIRWKSSCNVLIQ